MVERVRAALTKLAPATPRDVHGLFTAHSVPLAMAQTSSYVAQLNEACRLVAEGAGLDRWRLVYQSRSGPPSQPWLEPDVGVVLREIAAGSPGAGVLIVPIGFISDHMEVLFDLDVEARQICDELGLVMVRAGTVGTHPRFVTMIRELIEERISEHPRRLALGALGPSHDVCPVDCCAYTPRRPSGN
jgi:ferrochelatase